MQVKIIKGTKQIGGCITEIKCNNARIIIDFGEDLEDNSKLFSLEGLTYGKPIYDAVFITHSHGDHIGLVDKIIDSIPVYVEEATLNIHNLTCDFCGKERVKRKVKTFKLERNCLKQKEIYNEKGIKVIPLIIDHSSYNSCMYLIEGNNKTILHTGDFRNHGRVPNSLDNIIKRVKKVDLLITEGTTLTREKEKYLKEEELEKIFEEKIKEYDQIFILQSSTNISRTVSFLKASLKNHKKFVFDIFSYHLLKVTNLNIQIDYKNKFVWIPKKYENKELWFKEKYLDVETSNYIYPNFTMEIKESMLPEIKKMYKKGRLTNTCLIYSMWDGYIEKEPKLNNFIKELEKMNIDFYKFHTSGHADLETMKKLNNGVNPNKTIIIHTESSANGFNIFNNVQHIEDNQTIII